MNMMMVWIEALLLLLIGVSVVLSSVTCLDPGLSNCTTNIVTVIINGDDGENIHPKQQLGEHSLTHSQ